MSAWAGSRSRAIFYTLLGPAWGVAAFAGVAGPAAAQSEADSPRTPTVTRWIKVFGDLESRLDAAARANDAKAFDQLLADDFELRNATRPGAPVPRAEFIQQMLGKPRPGARIEQMAVHDLGTAAIVSFLARYGDGAPLFVVDVWGSANDEWQLKVRYAGPGGMQAPSADAPMPDSRGNLPKKY